MSRAAIMRHLPATIAELVAATGLTHQEIVAAVRGLPWLPAAPFSVTRVYHAGATEAPPPQRARRMPGPPSKPIAPIALRLARSGPVTSADVAREARCDQSAALRVLHGLEARGELQCSGRRPVPRARPSLVFVLA